MHIITLKFQPFVEQWLWQERGELGKEASRSIHTPCTILRAGTITGLDYWTGLLDSTTGLDYWSGLLDSPKLQHSGYTSFSAEEKLNYFTSTASCSIFPGVSRGQRSCAYLLSFTFGGYGWIQLSSNKLWAPTRCINWKVCIFVGKHLHKAINWEFSSWKD